MPHVAGELGGPCVSAVFMDSVFSPTSYFFPTLLGVSSVVQPLSPLLLFSSGLCHVREKGLLLERLIVARVDVSPERLVPKKREFLGQRESKKTQKHFSEGKKVIRQMTVGWSMVLPWWQEAGLKRARFPENLLDTPAFRGLKMEKCPGQALQV